MQPTEEDMPATAARPMVRVTKRPLCPKHGDSMCAYSTHTAKTYYICRTEGCKSGDDGRAFKASVPRRGA